MNERDPQQPHYTCPTCGASVTEEGQFCGPTCWPDFEPFYDRDFSIIQDDQVEIHEHWAPGKTRRVAVVFEGLLSFEGATKLAKLFVQAPALRNSLKALLKAWEEQFDRHYRVCDCPECVARELLEKLEEENG